MVYLTGSYFLSNCSFTGHLCTTEVSGSNPVFVLNTWLYNKVGVVSVSETCSFIKLCKAHRLEFFSSLNSSVDGVTDEVVVFCFTAGVKCHKKRITGIVGPVGNNDVTRSDHTIARKYRCINRDFRLFGRQSFL